jgi:hypothetical protein
VAVVAINQDLLFEVRVKLNIFEHFIDPIAQRCSQV